MWFRKTWYVLLYGMDGALTEKEMKMETPGS